MFSGELKRFHLIVVRHLAVIGYPIIHLNQRPTTALKRGRLDVGFVLHRNVLFLPRGDCLCFFRLVFAFSLINILCVFELTPLVVQVAIRMAGIQGTHTISPKVTEIYAFGNHAVMP